jgi:putative ABC transport system permease protein
MDNLRQTLRYAMRTFVRRPGFTAAVTLTLALGIGANTAIFSFVNGILLRPLPYPAADRLVTLWTMLPEWGKEVASWPDYNDWKSQSTVFTRVAGYANSSVNLSSDDEAPERLASAVVTEGLFETLGISPMIGRQFTSGDFVFGAHRVAILSHDLWVRRFASNPAIVGKTILLSARPYLVVGIAPPAMRLPERAQLWTPYALTPDNAPNGRRSDFLAVVARLKPDASAEKAQTEMNAIAKRLGDAYPQTNTNVGIGVIPLQRELVGNVRDALLVFGAAVGLVLLIACANVANLLLARSTSREREMAVRSALGAGRTRLIRQLLVESVLLSALGAVVGLLLAIWGVQGLTGLVRGSLPRLYEVKIDLAALLFTGVTAVLTGLLFGLAPALRLSGMTLASAIAEGGRGAIGGRGDRLRAGLVLAQVALALMLLAGSGLLVKSFRQLQRVDLGFDDSHALAVQVALPGAKYGTPQQRSAFFEALTTRLVAEPGVQTIGLTSDVPLSTSYDYITVAIIGRPQPAAGERTPDAIPTIADTGYFRALRIPLLEGRMFGPEDRPTSPRVAVVNREFVQRYLRGQPAIGERITFGNPSDSTQWLTIVGIVGTTRLAGVGKDSYPQVFAPFSQTPNGSMYVVLRTAGNPLAVVSSVRRDVTAVDPTQPIADIRSMEQRVDDNIAQSRLSSLLVGFFALVALALASIGIYGVISYAVAQRTREIGIRIALGATTGEVLRLVVRQGMTPAILGIALGLAGAFMTTRLMSKLLFGVSPTDPLIFAGVTVVLTAVALVACWLPARRAARVDPVTALRYE